jgi:hypothetical protein
MNRQKIESFYIGVSDYVSALETKQGCKATDTAEQPFLFIRQRDGNFKTRGMDMEAFKNKSINFWPFRRAVILLYNEKVISREKFIELWEAVYGK